MCVLLLPFEIAPKGWHVRIRHPVPWTIPSLDRAPLDSFVLHHSSKVEKTRATCPKKTPSEVKKNPKRGRKHPRSKEHQCEVKKTPSPLLGPHFFWVWAPTFATPPFSATLCSCSCSCSCCCSCCCCCCSCCSGGCGLGKPVLGAKKPTAPRVPVLHL